MEIKGEGTTGENLGVISTQMVFKAVGLVDITQGTRTDRRERRLEKQSLQH